jgi:hypothetical protein
MFHYPDQCQEMIDYTLMLEKLRKLTVTQFVQCLKTIAHFTELMPFNTDAGITLTITSMQLENKVYKAVPTNWQQ